jgi:hypothetical protein
VPDVSYVADPNTGLYVYCSTYSRRGSWFQVGGTSAGAPQWAALIALANQGRASGVNGNNDIYSTTVAGTPPTIANNFLDISSGSNGSDQDDFSLVGYDLVTGLGSPVATGVVPALVSLAPASPDFSVSVTPTSQTVASGGSTSYTVTVRPLGGFIGIVNFSVSGLPTDASYTLASVTGSGSSTLTITAGATPGTFLLTVTGTSSGSLTHWATATLMIVAPNFSISASPTSQTVKQGKSTSYTVTVAPSSGFTGTVSLGANVSPVVSGGPTVSFNPQSVRIRNGSGNSTMTVSTSNRTPTGTYTITISGTGGSTQQGTSVSLAVK